MDSRAVSIISSSLVQLGTQSQRQSQASSSRRLDLVEYQAKALLASVAIPVLPSQLVHGVEDLRSLTYPVLLKSQVHWDNRQGEGGVIQVRDRLDAIAACQTLLHRSIQGEYPEALLAEPIYSAEHEIQVSLMRAAPGDSPRLLLRGSVNQLSSESVLLEVAEDGDSLADGITLGQRLGLRGPALKAFGDIIKKVHNLFSWANLKFLALSPVAIRADGHAVALDAQMRFAVPSLTWQSQLDELLLPRRSAPPLVHLDGNIGILGSSVGRTLATVEQLKQAGGSTAAFVAFQNSAFTTSLSHPPAGRRGDAPGPLAVPLEQHWQVQQRRQLTQSLCNLSRLREVKATIVHWRGGSVSCRIVAEALLVYLRLAARPGLSARPMPVVVCWKGAEAATGHQLLEGTDVTVVSSLEAAIAQAMGFSKLSSRSYHP